MKITYPLSNHTSIQLEPSLEEEIAQKHNSLKELARKNGKHHAARNAPAPSEENLEPYIGDLNGGYEVLGAFLLQRILPSAHAPESRIDGDYFKDQDRRLEEEIKEKEDQNLKDHYEIGQFDPHAISMRLRLVIILTSIIGLGEILYNTKAFQVIGDSMLFALFISIAVSIAVFLFSHLTSFLCKGAKTASRKRLIALGSLLFITGVFIVIALLRSSYLAEKGVEINPVYFVIINLLFYVVTTLLSYFLLPTWIEIKENYHRLKLLNNIKVREKEIKILKQKREEIKLTVLERTKLRVRAFMCTEYCGERIKKMNAEAVKTFISTNLTFRKDGLVPVCFSGYNSKADINNFFPRFPDNSQQ